MKNDARFWDRIAPKYYKSAINDVNAYNATLERTRSYLRPGHSVLELGCGTAGTAVALVGSVARYVASDFSAEMLAQARQRPEIVAGGNIELVQADTLSETLRSEQFDVVMALNLLHLIDDVDATLDRVNTMLKPGGVFISKTPVEPVERAPFRYRFLRKLIPLMQLLGKAPFVRFMTIGELDQRIQSAGFEIIEQGNYPNSPPNRYVVARKKTAA